MKNEPRLIFWELTKRCNLQCQHCRAEADDSYFEGEMKPVTSFNYGTQDVINAALVSYGDFSRIDTAKAVVTRKAVAGTATEVNTAGEYFYFVPAFAFILALIIFLSVGLLRDSENRYIRKLVRFVYGVRMFITR